MKTWYMIFAAACAVSMPAFADGDGEGDEPAAIRVTSEAVTFKLRTGDGTAAVSSADLATWPVTYRAGETVTLTSPAGASTTPVSGAVANGETALAGASSPIVTVASLAFSSGKGVRILNAETLDTATFGDTKSLATSTAQIAALPPLTFVASDGTTIADTGKWHYRLSPDRHTLKFGAHCGLLILVR